MSEERKPTSKANLSEGTSPTNLSSNIIQQLSKVMKPDIVKGYVLSDVPLINIRPTNTNTQGSNNNNNSQTSNKNTNE